MSIEQQIKEIDKELNNIVSKDVKYIIIALIYFTLALLLLVIATDLISGNTTLFSEEISLISAFLGSIFVSIGFMLIIIALMLIAFKLTDKTVKDKHYLKKNRNRKLYLKDKRVQLLKRYYETAEGEKS